MYLQECLLKDVISCRAGACHPSEIRHEFTCIAAYERGERVLVASQVSLEQGLITLFRHRLHGRLALRDRRTRPKREQSPNLVEQCVPDHSGSIAERAYRHHGLQFKRKHGIDTPSAGLGFA
jgi:hypothetical protein